MSEPADRERAGPADAWITAGALALALAVGLGAFGAHALKARLTPEALEWWHVATQYHAWHGLALFAVAFVASRRPGSRWVTASGVAFVVGIVFFSGSLYAMALTGWRRLGMVTPFGGTGFIVGFLLLARAARPTRK